MAILAAVGTGRVSAKSRTRAICTEVSPWCQSSKILRLCSGDQLLICRDLFILVPLVLGAGRNPNAIKVSARLSSWGRAGRLAGLSQTVVRGRREDGGVDRKNPLSRS